MVTLKNNFGVEPDKDSDGMNVSEGSTNDTTKSSASGHPRAILICRRNSHPFQARILILNNPAKIGRSVARARPSSYNGIFDCKVLSRNHAIIWYEYDTGKFMIQDTKSSNGTFVNNQRLSKGGETSSPREFFSRDVVQFGVDVLENQRKGNEESDNSDESNHIVTHGCIVATVRLFHPNGKESKSGQPYSAANPVSSVSQEKICKLELIIHEAQQREERLHDKLEELQLIISKLEVACQEALTNRFEETRLLSKIESLEKQTKVMNKIMSGGTGKSSDKVEGVIQQLLVDIEKIQSVAREIQERQHRKLLESEQKLVEAQRVASNLELEVIGLREQASLTESHLQEMGSKCTNYCQTIETLKSNFHAQIELTQKLESRLAQFEDRDFRVNFSESNHFDKFKFISDGSEDEICKKDFDSQEIILEWCKTYEDSDKLEEKDFICEQDKTEWIMKKQEHITEAMCNGVEHISNRIGELENLLTDVEKCKKNIEKLCIKKHELILQLESAKIPTEGNEKTEYDLDGEKHEIEKSVMFTSLSNEKITELENELKNHEDSLSQERVKQKESDEKYTKLRYELDVTIKHCEKLKQESRQVNMLLREHLKSLEESTGVFQKKIVELETKQEELEHEREQKLLEVLKGNEKNLEEKETQTRAVPLVSSSTNTELTESDVSKFELVLEVDSENRKFKPNAIQEPLLSRISGANSVTGFTEQISNLDNSSPTTVLENEEFLGKSESNFKSLEKEWPSENLGTWEKIQKIHKLFSLQSSKNLTFSSAQLGEIRNLVDLITEDFVHLLLREQQMSNDKQSLEKKLNKSLSMGEKSFGLAAHKYLCEELLGLDPYSSRNGLPLTI